MKIFRFLKKYEAKGLRKRDFFSLSIYRSLFFIVALTINRAEVFREEISPFSEGIFNCVMIVQDGAWIKPMFTTLVSDSGIIFLWNLWPSGSFSVLIQKRCLCVTAREIYCTQSSANLVLHRRRLVQMNWALIFDIFLCFIARQNLYIFLIYQVFSDT